MFTLKRGGWAAVASIAGATFLLVTSEFLPIGLLGSIARAFGISDGTAGLMVTVPGIVAAVAAPSLALLASRVERRLVLSVLTVAIVVSSLIVMLATSWEMLLAGRVLLGIGVGGLWTFAVAVGRRLVPEASGGRATSVISAGIAIGTVVGVPVGVTIGSLAGWRVAFGATAAFGILVLTAQLLLLPRMPSLQRLDLRGLFSLLKVAKARTGLAAALLLAGGQFAAYTYLEPFLRGTARLDPAALAYALTAYGVAGIAGTFLGERAMARSSYIAFTGVALALSIAIAAAGLLGDRGFAIPLVALWGLAFGAIPVCIQIWLHQAAPDRFEAGSALLVSVFQIALASGAFIGGLAADSSGIPAAMLLGAMLAAAAFLVVLASGLRISRPLPAVPVCHS